MLISCYSYELNDGLWTGIKSCAYNQQYVAGDSLISLLSDRRENVRRVAYDALKHIVDVSYIEENNLGDYSVFNAQMCISWWNENKDELFQMAQAKKRARLEK